MDPQYTKRIILLSFQSYAISYDRNIRAYKRSKDSNFDLKFLLKSDAFVLRYLIPKKPDHILQKRDFFGILYLEKETAVVAENFRKL